VSAAAGRAAHHVWALDYQFDVTATGRVIKILHVVDEFTRESPADLGRARTVPNAALDTKPRSECYFMDVATYDRPTPTMNSATSRPSTGRPT
jgi:hypothetical protein